MNRIIFDILQQFWIFTSSIQIKGLDMSPQEAKSLVFQHWQYLNKLAVILQQLPNTEKLSLYDKLYRYTDFIQQDLGYRTP